MLCIVCVCKFKNEIKYVISRFQFKKNYKCINVYSKIKNQRKNACGISHVKNITLITIYMNIIKFNILQMGNVNSNLTSYSSLDLLSYAAIIKFATSHIESDADNNSLNSS